MPTADNHHQLPERRDWAGHSGRVTTATTHFSLRADSVKRLCPGAARSADLTLAGPPGTLDRDG